MDTTPTAFCGPGLIVSDRPAAREGLLISLVAKIRGALVCCGHHGLEGYVPLPFGLAAFLGAVFLTALVVWRVAPKWLR